VALRRPRHPMPSDLSDRLKASRTLTAYRERPAYQRNDYIGWIEAAKTVETRSKRLAQMIDELRRGDVYMKMAWHAGESRS
jgi:uncharacterized protein YdeI (YjbR/CyaY-like superfamily)